MRLFRAGFMIAGLASLVFAMPATAQGAAKTVTCADGSTSKGGQGACSGHGGIKAATAAPAMVKCTDGTMSKPGQGACSGHGGIAKAAAPKPATSAAPAPTPVARKAGAPKPATTPPPTTPPPAAPKPKPAAATAPPAQGKPTAQCKDGTLSYAKTHQGACSSHGGVAKWLDGTGGTQ